MIGTSFAFAATAIATLASVPAGTPEAAKAKTVAVRDGKVCVNFDTQTGKLLERESCRTRAQWDARGVSFVHNAKRVETAAR